MSNLFAICRTNDKLEVKRIVVSQDVQGKISGLFTAQYNSFLEGVIEEVKFGTDWKPDNDEILVVDAPEEAKSTLQAMTGDVLALSTIDAANFGDEGIKALAIINGTPENPRILIQVFTAQQILSRRFALMFSGDTFRELTEPAFTLDNSLVAIIENGRLKFKSYFHVKRIFEITYLYQAATNEQIDTFCAHENLNVPDVIALKATADQTIRKLIHAIHTAKVLDKYNVDDIAKKAQLVGMEITLIEGKINFPSDKKLAKYLLRFLDDGIYEAPLTARRYITNSKSPYT